MKNIIADFSAKIQSYDSHDKERILRAALWVHELYEKQNASQEINGVEHSLAVAEILTDLKLDASAVWASPG
jgi:(p)ppGpp synthase/HD superfamily hydrolase